MKTLKKCITIKRLLFSQKISTEFKTGISIFPRKEKQQKSIRKQKCKNTWTYPRSDCLEFPVGNALAWPIDHRRHEVLLFAIAFAVAQSNEQCILSSSIVHFQFSLRLNRKSLFTIPHEYNSGVWESENFLILKSGLTECPILRYLKMCTSLFLSDFCFQQSLQVYTSSLISWRIQLPFPALMFAVWYILYCNQLETPIIKLFVHRFIQLKRKNEISSTLEIEPTPHCLLLQLLAIRLCI